MKIVIDARFLGPEGTGVGTYVENLVENLSQIDSKNEYIILLKKSNFHLFNPKGDNFKKIEVNAHWYSVKEQVLIPLAIFREKPDLVHFPHFNVPLAWRGKFVVTVHDLTISEYGRTISTSKFYPAYLAKRFFYNLTLRKALFSSQKILVPSNLVKKDLIKNFKLLKNKVAVTYEAADEFFIKYGKKTISEGEERKVMATYGVKKPFILTVGIPFPQKNIVKVLEALTTLPKELSLVHVSARNKFSENLMETSSRFKVDKRFVQTGRVTNEDLSILYKGAEALVFPSLSEGFGLPGLEAMASGCPVIVSDIEVFKEVYGDAALYFNPKNNLDLANKIESIIQNDELKDEQIKKGLKQVKKYSWEKLAKETLKIYSSLDY